MNENKRLKVLLVSPYSAKHTGGIGTWSKIVLDYGKAAEDVELLFLNTATSLPKRWAMGNRLAHLLVGGIDSLRILLVLFWEMLVLHPDVVHYTSSADAALRKDLIAIWIVKGVFGKKFVIHWHFGRIPSIFQERGKEHQLFLKVCSKVDTSITLDESSYQVLMQEGIRAVNVPNPIPVNLQKEAEKLNDSDLMKDRKAGDVLFVGHMLKTKGLTELVRVCSECKSVKNLICVGPFFDENYREELRSIAKKREDGSWLKLVGEKNREEVWKYYKQCNVFCLPSYSEGFPYVILEAMAFGCPIVATNVGAIPEMVGEGCGDTIGVRQVKPLQEALEIAINDSDYAENMGRKAHQKVLSEYTIERVYEMYYKTWQSVVL
jgi:glycosyltransferase involved in cell wall biosynthesis